MLVRTSVIMSITLFISSIFDGEHNIHTYMTMVILAIRNHINRNNLNTFAGDSDESDSALSGSNQNNSTLNGGPQSPVTQMVEGDADLLLKTPNSQGGGGQGGQDNTRDGDRGTDDNEVDDVEDACKAVAAILPDISLKTPLQGAWHRGTVRVALFAHRSPDAPLVLRKKFHHFTQK